MRFWQRLIPLLKDDRGQSTTEYILILSVVVMLAMKFKTIFMDKMSTAINKVGTNIDNFTDQSQ